MKIARILLTASILFSLKSTLYCSQEDPIDVKSHDTQESTAPTNSIVRKKSYDGTRDGYLGSAQNTFNNLGQSYTGPFGTEDKIYDFGSDELAHLRWAEFGKTIKTLSDAKKWIAAIERKGWSLPQDCMQPSLDIITADKESQISENYVQFESMQADSRVLVVTIATMNEKRIIEDQARNQYFAEKIRTITEEKALELATRKQLRRQEDLVLTNDLKAILEKTKNFRLVHNENFPDNAIVANPVIKRGDIDQLNPGTLATIAAKYNKELQDAQKK